MTLSHSDKASEGQCSFVSERSDLESRILEDEKSLEKYVVVMDCLDRKK